MTTNQVKLSVLCTFISIFLLVFLIISALVWLNTGTTSYILVAIIGLLCCIVPAISQGLDTYRMYDSINEETDANDAGEAEDGTNLLQVWETYRMTQPKKWYCYARILVEIVSSFFGHLSHYSPLKTILLQLHFSCFRLLRFSGGIFQHFQYLVSWVVSRIVQIKQNLINKTIVSVRLYPGSLIIAHGRYGVIYSLYSFWWRYS